MKKSFTVKTLALFLLIAMMAVYLPETEIVTVQAAETKETVFSRLGLSTAIPEDNSTRKNMDPYGSKTARIFTVDELFLYGWNVGDPTEIETGYLYGHNTDVTQKIPDGNSMPSINSTFNNPMSGRLSAMEGNFTGNGIKDKIAVLKAGIYQGGIIGLYIFDPADTSNGGKLDFITIEDDIGWFNVTGIENYQIQQNLHMATGDIDGNGIDEIIMLIPSGQRTPGKQGDDRSPELLYYSLPENAGPDDWKDGSKWTRYHIKLYDLDYRFRYGTTHSLAVGDLNGDNLDDIAVTCSVMSTYDRSYPSRFDSSKTINLLMYSTKITADVYYSNGDGSFKQEIIPIDSYKMTYSDLFRAQTAVFIGDADGIPGNELLFGYRKFNNIICAYEGEDTINELRSYGYSVEMLKYSQNPDNNGMYRISRKNNLPVVDEHEIDGYYNLKTPRISYDEHLLLPPLCIAATPMGGTDTVPYIYVNINQHKYDENTKGYVYVNYTPDVFYNVVNDISYTIYSLRPCNLNGNQYGIMCFFDNNGQQSIIIRLSELDSNGVPTGRSHQPLAKSFHKGRPAMAALPDTDCDSVILAYKGYNLLFSDPIVLAAIASPPFFNDLKHVPGGDAHVGSSFTSFASTSGSGQGETKSQTVNIGAYVSVEMKVKTPFCKAAIETEVNYNHGFTWENDSMKTVSESVKYTTAGGQDSVALFAIPIDVFTYDMYYPADDKGESYEKTSYNVVFPYSPVNTVVPIDKYNQIRTDYPDVLPNIDKEIFTHNVGYPDTYPKSKIKSDAFVAKTPASAIGNAGVEQSLTITEEYTHTYSNTNSVDIKVGGGNAVGLPFCETEIRAGITSGYEDTRGKVTVNTTEHEFTASVWGIPADISNNYNYNFSWQMMYYEYTGLQNFPVITYIVNDVRSPALLPGEYWAEGSSENSVSLAWIPSKEDLMPNIKNIGYTVYRIGRSQGQDVYIEPDNGKLEYDYSRNIYTFIEEGLAPGTDYNYVIQTRRLSELKSISVYSAVINTGTLAIVDAGFTRQPQGFSLYPDMSNTEISAVFNRGGATSVTYNWQKKSGSSWASIQDNNGNYSGQRSQNLIFKDISTDMAGQYRLRAAVEYNTQLSLIYSNEIDITYEKRPTSISVSQPVIGEETVTLKANVSSTSDYQAVPSGDVTFNISGFPNFNMTVSSAINSDGSIEAVTSIKNPGIYSVTATYGGSTVFGKSGIASPITFVRDIDKTEVPILASNMAETYTYGDFSSIRVLQYSVNEPSGKNVSNLLNYTLEKMNPNYGVEKAVDSDIPWIKTKTNGWIQGNTISFKDTGSYRITITDPNSQISGILPATCYFRVLPRAITVSVENVVKVLPEQAQESDLKINASGLASSDSLEQLGYKNGVLAVYDLSGSIKNINTINTVGFYKIGIKNNYVFEENETCEQSKYSITFNEGSYNLIDTTSTQYDIIVDIDGDGKVNGSGKYYENSIVKLSASPAFGYRFEGWYENDVKINNTGDIYKFASLRNRSLTAKFTQDLEILTPDKLLLSQDSINSGEYYKLSLSKPSRMEFGVAGENMEIQVINSTGSVERVPNNKSTILEIAAGEYNIAVKSTSDKALDMYTLSVSTPVYENSIFVSPFKIEMLSSAVRVTSTITKNNPEGKDVILLLGLYGKDRKLVASAYQVFDVSGTIDYSVTLDTTGIDLKDKYIEIFLWDGLSNQAPFMNKRIYEFK